ncbi:poly(A) RNA polymerase gld-2 homolog A-like isoform X3 [Belonocnema kinseyi]|uniref:poly(A) RNA polymerase gld-2 homolog A-like isoform X3 n=1 Tax=Belonocnema kinseyi TaxID=2817044 RepID=UPI00143DF2CD|nr:poly(A) RNA polymerase gld-2 homolog A-like isoform X3 [Belonocnema kinseyi]XP_033232075.1 poly(A) RNA polymerase gld-2 homolog A-like isoform X3 [Belonocnema kinseyi]
MYHTTYSPHTMVQIMGGQGGQQAGGQCLPAQNHTAYYNGASPLHQTEYTQYVPDASNHNRHPVMQAASLQTGCYPIELIQLMGVNVQEIRRVNYSNMHGNGTSNNSWAKRMSPTQNVPTMPPPSQVNFRPASTGSVKKSNYNKAGKRNANRESFSPKEAYNSDSGFSSRSPTPNKHQNDSLTESSDERDSINSQGEQGTNFFEFCRRLQEVHPNVHHMHNSSSINRGGLISSTTVHQFYQSQRPVNCYHSPIQGPRAPVQNYQNKRRYHSGRNSPPQQRMQRNRNKFSQIIAPTYFYPRYIMAPDRFLERSHLVEVTQRPDNLLTNSIFDGLSEDMWEKFVSNQQTEKTYINKMMLWKYLFISIKFIFQNEFPKYGLFLVGSTMNGFGSNRSDVDMCLLIKHTEMDQRNEAIFHLDQILRSLKKCNFVTNLELIQAKVPILKFHDVFNNIDIDLNCNNSVGIRNTHLMYCYSQIDWRVRPLVLVVKLWAQCQNINNAKNMTISSYSLALMVIHFLQCGTIPAVLPCLQSIFKHKFDPLSDIHSIDIHENLNIPINVMPPPNHLSLGELLVQFFKYYVSFDFSQYAISVRLAKKVPIEECRWARSYKNDPHQWKFLCIEEPFDQTNTARSVYDPEVFVRIKQVFKLSYQRLTETRKLSSIFVKLEVKSKPSLAPT